MYMLTLSKYFIFINVTIITCIKNILKKISSIILFPLKMLLKILQKAFFRPFLLIFINFRNGFKKILPKNIKTLKFFNNSSKKSIK